MTRFTTSLGSVAALAAGLVTAHSAIAQIGPPRNELFVGGQTSSFFYDNGTGVQQPGTVTTSFTLNTVIQLWASRRGYDYYKAQSDFSSANTQNNPYFNDNVNAGEIPNFRYIAINPIAAAPQSIDDAGLYVGDGTAALPDLWDGMSLRVDFLNDAFQVGLSYAAEGRITLTGSTSGKALQQGVANTYTFSTLGGPLRAMTPVSSGGGSPPVGSFYLQDISFTTTLVPAPGAAALLGLGGLLATRRRR